jgi:transcriptional regulator
MYRPAHFAPPSLADVHRLIASQPLGALVRHGPSGFDADHIPLLLDPHQGANGALMGHVARANPLWRELRDGDAILVLFRGPQAYVSPNWYASKAETHQVVPTWNYMVANVHGSVRIHDDERFVRGVVAHLTRVHEAAASGKPWKMTDAPTNFIDARLKEIVGIEIQISRIDGKWKLSQNREARDHAGAIAGLDQRGELDMADAMKACGRTTSSPS